MIKKEAAFRGKRRTAIGVPCILRGFAHNSKRGERGKIYGN
jgi:hypothetical protein